MFPDCRPLYDSYTNVQRPDEGCGRGLIAENLKIINLISEGISGTHTRAGGYSAVIEVTGCNNARVLDKVFVK